MRKLTCSLCPRENLWLVCLPLIFYQKQLEKRPMGPAYQQAIETILNRSQEKPTSLCPHSTSGVFMGK